MNSILNVKESPYGLLLFTAMAIVIAIVFAPIADIDFQDKTMFSVPFAIMVWIIPLFLISLWLLYALTGRFLYSRTMTWIHVLITAFASSLIVVVLYLGINPAPLTHDRQVVCIGNAMQILSILFVFGQLAYFANVLLGLLDRHKTHRD